MLYDGALKFTSAAKRSMAQGNLAEQDRCLQRAQKIIAELISSLDLDKGGEISTNLLSLYTFCYNRLVDANLSDNSDLVTEVELVLKNLRAGWVELEQNLRSTGVRLEAA
jgi:flagellar protein FliS